MFIFIAMKEQLLVQKTNNINEINRGICETDYVFKYCPCNCTFQKILKNTKDALRNLVPFVQFKKREKHP